MEFPILYGKPSNSTKVKQWTISVIDNKDHCVIKRVHGYVDHKLTESLKTISSGKNIGKKNETTILEQAISEAKYLHNKQLQSGYVFDKNSLDSSNLFLPMLAHDYKIRNKDITFPCFIQPKLDGVRLTTSYVDGKLTLNSRTGKPFFGLDHIVNAIQNLDLPHNIILDGELFSFDLDFESICGICRKSKNIDANKMRDIKFFIFDYYDANNINLNFEERNKFLCKLKFKSQDLVLVDTKIANDKSDVDLYHEEFLKDKYEGVILRNKKGVYKPIYRSKDIQKYKKFIDAEYEIVNYSEATGNDEGTVIFICKDPKTNLKFSVRPKGSRELRKYWFENFNKVKGSLLTVKYQNLTEYGIPRFPVGVQIRDYE